MTAKDRPSVDWYALGLDYCAGILTNRAIGEKHGVSHTMVKKYADKEGLTKDLSQRIRAKAEEKVSKEAVSRKVSKESSLETEKSFVEASAEMMAVVMRGHRSDVGRLRSVVTALMEQVEQIVNETDLFRQIGEICLDPEKSGANKAADLYSKVLSLPQQTDSTKKLAETLKILIELERKIFKIDDPSQSPSGFTVTITQQDVRL